MPVLGLHYETEVPDFDNNVEAVDLNDICHEMDLLE